MSQERYATLHVARRKYEVVELRGDDGATRRLTAEDAREQFATLTPAQRKGATDFEHWWRHLVSSSHPFLGPDGVPAARAEVRTWVAELVTADGVAPVDLGEQLYEGDSGYPIYAAMRALDELAASGWRLVHVSEDRGLYKGADSPNEAYLSRVRYLLARSA